MSERFAIKCPLCGFTRGQVDIWGEDILLGFSGHFAVVRCERCRFRQTWPEMTVDQLHGYYPAQYYGNISQAMTIKWRTRLHELGRRLYCKIRDNKKTSMIALLIHPSWLDLALPFRQKPGRLLDVGTGWGRFVAGTIGLGWRAEALDISPTVAKVGTALGIPVYQGTLEENLDRLTGAYDLICFNHVLEHVPSPIETLRTVMSLLGPGGVVRVQVPLWCDAFVRLFGKYWYPLDLPRHRWHYRPLDVYLLAKKAGFNRILFMPETSTTSVQGSLKLLSRTHSGLKHWQNLISADNRILRAISFPLGWIMAALRRPFEATFYFMKV
jgi:2-polyprenyl-3-methyl-5-hydroxy-6-metoxy-1,4-benzoquinol methylase